MRSDIIFGMHSKGEATTGREPVANEKALRDLEFERARGIVRSYASSSLGEEAIDGLAPVSDRAWIETGIAEVAEAIGFLESHDRFSLGAVRDVVPLLNRARENAFLDGEEFLVVLHTIDGTREVRDRFDDPESTPRLHGYAARLTAGGGAFRKRLVRAIDERGVVRDDASPELKRLLGKARTLESRLESKLRVLIDRSPELISEPVITRRRGRLVVPIRSGATGAMEFIVHDRSASGQTLYAEPTGLVAENNQLAELAGEIREETRRVLRELTEAFVGVGASFLRDRAVLAHLDSLFARAAFAGAYRCAFPRLGSRIALRAARHPLLRRESVVPITLSLGDDARMTLITGPNTGGKTVTLKTVGLLTLMVQATIPIPASPDSEMAVVSRVRTDIGDEQSIEQSLSTFSAHMSNLVSILAEADSGTLVLLDELGAGTDPEEGAALGLAILEAVLDSDALAASSTHLTPLKFFAIQHPEIKTASMEFDLETLAPTFRVIEGIPGKSNAFVIAERLGLRPELVDRAKTLLSHGEIRAEDIIDELHRERQVLAKHREEAERERNDLRRIKSDYERKLAALEQDREAALSDRLRTLEASLVEGQRRLEKILAEAKAATRPEPAREGLHEIEALRRQTAARRADLEPPERAAGLDPETLDVGQMVHVRSLDSDGKVVHVEDNGKVSVDLDGIRVTTEVADLAGPTRRSERPSPSKRGKQRVHRPRPGDVPLQINVRGATVTEALREVEAYLDRLLLADVRSASILHGKGTGALRQAIHSYLASCSFVRSFDFAPANQGGEGVTVFELAGDEAHD